MYEYQISYCNLADRTLEGRFLIVTFIPKISGRVKQGSVLEPVGAQEIFVDGLRVCSNGRASA